MSCDETGAFIDCVPLLKRESGNGKEFWRPRDRNELSSALSTHFGLPIDISAEAAGLAAMARALNTGKIAEAQLITLHLNIPEPPSLVKSAVPRGRLIKFIQELFSSGLIKADWDPDEHPRWPAGAPDSQGGQFAPKGTSTNEPGIGHNGGPPLEAEEAEEVGEATAEESLAGELAALAGPILLAATGPLDDGEDQALERIHNHHPWPKYLGGAEKQLLSEMPEKLHIQFHNELDEIAPRWSGTDYYENLDFQEEKIELFRRVAEFVNKFDAQHGPHLYEEMIRNGFRVAP